MNNHQSESATIRVTAIIQARMQSKRLPGKSILPVVGKPLITHVIERTRAMKGVDCVVVATCAGNDDLVKCARDSGAETFVGSEHNVLERYTFAAREFGGDYIVRVTGDNPFTDAEFGSEAVAFALETGSDLSSLSGLPLGVGVEIIKRTALESAFNESSTPYHFEHVSPFIKERPERFVIRRKAVKMRYPVEALRLTVDTPEDYSLACRIYEGLYRGQLFSISDVLTFIESNPELMEINKDIVQRPMTHSENA
jgi:spore coat polysaccharide biosynthesis protein SpsF